MNERKRVKNLNGKSRFQTQFHYKVLHLQLDFAADDSKSAVMRKVEVKKTAGYDSRKSVRNSHKKRKKGNKKRKKKKKKILKASEFAMKKNGEKMGEKMDVGNSWQKIARK